MEAWTKWIKCTQLAEAIDAVRFKLALKICSIIIHKTQCKHLKKDPYKKWAILLTHYLKCFLPNIWSSGGLRIILTYFGDNWSPWIPQIAGKHLFCLFHTVLWPNNGVNIVFMCLPCDPIKHNTEHFRVMCFGIEQKISKITVLQWNCMGPFNIPCLRRCQKV